MTFSFIAIDQVDVLLSNLRNKLNIYNIQGTVYQKNISTNTQNNLYVIFNSPHYSGVRDIIVNIEDSLLNLTNIIIENNEDRNKIISQNLLYDVFWHYILHFNLLCFAETYSTFGCALCGEKESRKFTQASGKLLSSAAAAAPRMRRLFPHRSGAAAVRSSQC